MSKKHFLQGTFILTCAGFISRIIGFFYRIFLSHTIGAEGLGIYQLTVPLQTLVMALTTAGIQTTLSRICASKLALKKEKEACDYFSIGTAIALFLSGAVSLCVYTKAEFFAVQILKEPRTLSLLQLMAFSFPLSALHTCINSYFFARKKTAVPASLQLLEQIVRVGISYLLYLILLSEGKEITPLIAVGGSLASEIAVCILSLFILSIKFHQIPYSIRKITMPIQCAKDILQSALPLTLNRILLTLLSSIEVVLIPQQLCQYGINTTEALSIYGVFTGMALPVIMFPAAITNSAAVMLMPSVAQLHTLGRKKRIHDVTVRICLCCFALGSFFALFFFFLGEPTGAFLFKSPTAGTYIHTLSLICPFLYLNTTLTSILHGLEKMNASLIHSVISVGIRISFVILAIPIYGIRGYLYGILLSETVLCLLHFRTLFRYTHLSSADFPIDN